MVENRVSRAYLHASVPFFTLPGGEQRGRKQRGTVNAKSSQASGKITRAMAKEKVVEGGRVQEMQAPATRDNWLLIITPYQPSPLDTVGHPY